MPSELLFQDVRYAARLLRNHPGFAAVAVFTLALGIGANTAMFTLVNAVLLRSLPYSDPDRLVQVWTAVPRMGWLDLRRRVSTMDIAASSYSAGFNLTGRGTPVRLNGSAISVNLTSMFGVAPYLGRAFSPAEERSAESHVVLLSYSLWQTQFGADPALVGRSITLDGADYVVVGVMPPSFRFPTSAAQLWVPIVADTPPNTDLWGGDWLQPVGRLHRDVTLAQATAELKAVTPDIVRGFPWKMPAHWGEWGGVVPLHDSMTGALRPKLLVLFAAVGLVLLIACANVANLLLARAAARQKEIAVRTALGAARGRIVRQLLTENLLIASLGGAAAVLIAWSSLRAVINILPSETPRQFAISLDGRVLAFSAAVALLTGLLFGLLPALRYSRLDVEAVLRASSSAAGVSRQRRRLASVLVVLEAALACVLVIGAGLLVRSLWELTRADLGVVAEHVVTARITPAQSMCRPMQRCLNFYDALLARVAAIPKVSAAGLADPLPLTGGIPTVLAVEDRPDITAASPWQCWGFTVSPGYLRSMGIPLLRGRDFSPDDRLGAPGAVLISKSLAQGIWPGQDPVGKYLKPSWMQGWRTVVGVVGDVRAYAVVPRDFGFNTVGEVYYPAAQGIISPPTNLQLVVRTTSDAPELARSLRDAVAATGADVPVSDIRTMDETVATAMAVPRSTTWVFLVFALLALALAAIGSYSVISCSVNERTHELAVRIALGASRSQVLAMVIREGMLLAGLGIAAGLAASLALGRSVSALLFGVRPTDPLTFVTVPMVLALIALLGCFLPARRATRVDPAIALRAE